MEVKFRPEIRSSSRTDSYWKNLHKKVSFFCLSFLKLGEFPKQKLWAVVGCSIAAKDRLRSRILGILGC